MPSLDSNLARVRDQVATMRALTASHGERIAIVRSDISGWSASEHFDHLVKVCEGTLTLLVDETSPALPGINLLGRVILGIGRIPRGRARSPKSVIGTPATAEQLHASLDRLATLVDRYASSPHPRASVARVRHPRFGGLNDAQTLRFLGVHNDHHLRIANEVLAP
jgi:hypothetical protein